MTEILVGFDKTDYPFITEFEKLGHCTFTRYDSAFLEETIGRYDVLVPHLFLPLSDNLLAKAQRLKVVATPSTGSDHLNLDAMRRRGIHFISLNDDRAFIDRISSTAELTWLLILGCMRKLRFLDHRVQVEKSWINTDIRGFELQGKTLGIIGYGRLGKMVARYGKAFDMEVIAYDINPAAIGPDALARTAGFEDLLSHSDVVSLHAKLNETSRNMIDSEAIQKMKDGVVIVNTARGGLLESEAVLAGLASGKIAAVALDVCNLEYQTMQLPEDPLVSASFKDRRIIITPHAGGSTYDAHELVFDKIAMLVGNYLKQ